ncbi:MAG: glycosyltransferase family 2 protein [Actinomycetota bacterium]|nr:glycosyltransferase family 2 protein [Actinomycetota bacterium]
MTPSVPTISIIIPARNEARNLEVVLPELPFVHQVVLIDGHSVDDTIETAKRLMPDIHVVQQTRKGKGNALACGFAAATGDIIVMFDADGSADPAEIPAFVQALIDGADVAKGSRYARGGGSEDITGFRSLGNRGLNFLTNLLLRSRFTDLCYGYNAFWRRVVPSLELPDHTMVAEEGVMVWGDGFEIETLLNCRFFLRGHRIVEVPSVERNRIFGTSNLNAISDGLRVLRTIIAERGRGLSVAPSEFVAGATRVAPEANMREAA